MHGRSKFNRKHKVIYDKDGFDRNGFDKDGYDRNGYDRSGFDRSGFDIDGHYEDDYYDHNCDSSLESDSDFEEKFFLLGFGDD